MGETEHLLERIEKLIDIGIALSAESSIARLLEKILLGAKEITNADGGTLYSVQENQSVKMEILRTDSLNFAMGGTTDADIPFAPIPLYGSDGRPNHRNVVTHAVLNDCTINIPDAYGAEGFDFAGTREFDRTTGYRSTSFLTVPLKNHEGDIIGVLQLLNAQDDAGKVVPFSAEAQRMTEALASQAAVALTNRRLIADLQQLFESFIKLIADAIDEKSPYTGGHCRRVPVITMLLADAVAKVTDGPLRDFSMSEADRYELEVAAWLHDCGKVTTPEYVVDKSTKLETIYDRVHEVDARFEILRRDAEIALLRRRLDNPAQADQLLKEYQDTVRQLEDDRDFIHRSNQGGEFMRPEDQARVEAVGRRTWIDAAGAVKPLLTDNEIRNLNIAKGTLTDDERQVINNHIVATINMLEALSFPKHLKRVPEFAGGHHERSDGHGYPRGLSREQMSVQARIMAIADVFEALTARDRPYKPGKKLSDTLRIMAHMKLDGHLDPDLFDVFIREGVYQQYASQYLDPEQIDHVDITQLPGFGG
ncbi:MAG: phosphohydrolase [Gammaproteobacteria bacterium HGW-Gammaproteobacteria-1]|nr:MAG: phosphohydrolase [Gammaproteobacteria bacterium HGW-Gammaproteobacteria-1]